MRPNLQTRALVFQETRTFFGHRGFLEVDTPVRAPVVAPERYIRPFDSDGWFLSTSPELHMKRLLAAGYDRVFQITRCFRKAERGRRHNPEFTMLEWYRVGGDYSDVIQDAEDLVLAITDRLGRGRELQYQGCRIDLAPPWPKITVRDAFLGAAGWDPVAGPDSLRFDIDLTGKVIPGFDPHRPAVLLDYPAAMASLARLKPGDPDVAERAEVFIGGLEIANAYSELRDAREQEMRFREEIESIREDQKRDAAMPARFLDAVRHLPQCSGIALGLDRLVMLFCDAGSIDEVMAFTSDTA